MAVTAIEERDATATGRGIVTPMSEKMMPTRERPTLSRSSAQREWAARSLKERLELLKRARHVMAARTADLCAAISPELARNAADTRVAEVLPLLAACEFLEREAAKILAPRKLGRKGRPFWLRGVTSEVERVPMGRVMVIAPSNYPLYLPGVQVLQALAAGNAVIWKPGRSGRKVAMLFAEILRGVGLPERVLEVTDESVAAAYGVIAERLDKVFFTGSVESGRVLLARLADTLTPCVAELSGCDAVFVLSTADLALVAKALTFGMRLNGSATCMAPRRVFVMGTDGARRREFLKLLLAELKAVKAVRTSREVQQRLQELLEYGATAEAVIHGEVAEEQRPIVVEGLKHWSALANRDIFAPVLSLINARDSDDAIAMNDECMYALTASVFGEEKEARKLAARITAGTVTINDLIVPTADPRVPFGGRRNSGFGTTRGAEGLLEMTAAKTILSRRGKSTRHFDATTEAHEELFDAVIATSHAETWKQRMGGMKKAISVAMRLDKKTKQPQENT